MSAVCWHSCTSPSQQLSCWSNLIWEDQSIAKNTWLKLNLKQAGILMVAGRKVYGLGVPWILLMLSFPTGTLTSKTFYFFWLDFHSFLAVNDPWPQLYISLSPSTWKRAIQYTWAQGHEPPVNSSYYRKPPLSSSETQAALRMKSSLPASNR